MRWNKGRQPGLRPKSCVRSSLVRTLLRSPEQSILPMHCGHHRPWISDTAALLLASPECLSLNLASLHHQFLIESSWTQLTECDLAAWEDGKVSIF